MNECIEREKVYEMLHNIGGCDAEPGSWANGWDKAIDTAIAELEGIPATDVEPDKIDLKPCPFCGASEIFSAFFKDSHKVYKIGIGCQECDYCITTKYYTKDGDISITETMDFINQVIQKWNTRSDKI